MLLEFLKPKKAFGKILNKARKKNINKSAPIATTVEVTASTPDKAAEKDGLNSPGKTSNALHNSSVLDVEQPIVFDLDYPLDHLALLHHRRRMAFVDCNLNCLRTSFESDAVLTLPKPATVIGTQEIVKFLGGGTYGKVYLTKDRVTGTKNALKVIKKSALNFMTLDAAVEEKAALLSLRDSPWFTRLEASWHDDANFYLITAYCPAPLDEVIWRAGGALDPDQARFYMAELVIGIQELHKRGMVHRDIKPANLLIDITGHLVIADVGLIRDFGKIPSLAQRVYQPFWPFAKGDEISTTTPYRNPRRLPFVAYDRCGTTLFMAPEIIRDLPYSFGVDYWAASVVLFSMLTGRTPFGWDERNPCPTNIQVVISPIQWTPAPQENVDEVAKDFIEQMLKKHPSERLRAEIDLPQHPYFEGINWERMKARQVPPPWVPSENYIQEAAEDEESAVAVGRPYKKGADPLPEFYFNPVHSLPDGAKDRTYSSEADDFRDAQNVVYINDHYRKHLAALPPLPGQQPRTDNNQSALVPPPQVVDKSVQVVPVIQHSHQATPHPGYAHLSPSLPPKNLSPNLISRYTLWLSKAFRSKSSSTKLKQLRPVIRL